MLASVCQWWPTVNLVPMARGVGKTFVLWQTSRESCIASFSKSKVSGHEDFETLPDPPRYFLKTAHFFIASIMAVAVKLRASETFYLNLTSLKLFIFKRQLCGHTVPWWQRPNFDSSLERNYYKKPLEYCFVRKHLSWFMCWILYHNRTRGKRNTLLTNHHGFKAFQSVKYLVNAAAQ